MTKRQSKRTGSQSEDLQALKEEKGGQGSEVVQTEELEELQKGLQQELDKFQPGQTERFHGIETREKEKPVKKKVHPLKVLAIILIVVLVILVLLVGMFFFLRGRGKSELLSREKSDVEFSVPEKLEKTQKVSLENDGIVVYNGQKYCYNDNIANILCMGIDKEKLNTEDTIASGDSGQADTLFLLSLDTETGKNTMLSISRDALVDVNAYSTSGKYVKTDKLQICLAYAYGDGKELSCENTMRSVSRLLYGVPVSSYAAIDLNAIGVLNDAVGGVELEVLEDLSSSDPALKAGERINLMGQQAEIYVRTRDSEGPNATADSNNIRMERQKQYLSAFAHKALAETKRDITVPLTLYNAASDYMVTNITASKVTYLASLMVQHGFSDSDILSVPGEAVMGEKYAEFHVDEEALYEMILKIFYKKVE